MIFAFIRIPHLLLTMTFQQPIHPMAFKRVTLTVHVWVNVRIVRQYRGPFDVDRYGYINLAESVDFLTWYGGSHCACPATYSWVTHSFQRHPLDTYLLLPTVPIILAKSSLAHHIGLGNLTGHVAVVNPPTPLLASHYRVNCCHRITCTPIDRLETLPQMPSLPQGICSQTLQ